MRLAAVLSSAVAMARMRRGGVHDVEAIGDDGTIYDIKALTAGGDRLDVKGLELSTEWVESIVNGVPVHAHVKDLPQVAAH